MHRPPVLSGVVPVLLLFGLFWVLNSNPRCQSLFRNARSNQRRKRDLGWQCYW